MIQELNLTQIGTFLRYSQWNYVYHCHIKLHKVGLSANGASLLCVCKKNLVALRFWEFLKLLKLLILSNNVSRGVLFSNSKCICDSVNLFDMVSFVNIYFIAKISI